MAGYFFDVGNRVLLIRFGQIFNSETLDQMYANVRWVVGRFGTCRGILDFTDVQSVEIDTSYLIQRSRSKAVLRGEQRVLVAPNHGVYGLLRMFQTYQDLETGDPPSVVHTLEEAFEMMELTTPDFQAIDMSTP